MAKKTLAKEIKNAVKPEKGDDVKQTPVVETPPSPEVKADTTVVDLFVSGKHDELKDLIHKQVVSVVSDLVNKQ